MKYIFFSLLLFLLSGIAYGEEYDAVIIPVTADKLQDEIISMHILSILNRKPNDDLYEYKQKGRKSLLMNHYKHQNWMLYVNFHEQVKAKGTFNAYCPPDKSFVDDISYYHVKYMLAFTSHSLSAINKEIASVFGGQHIGCLVKSYISKNRLKSYLYLGMENEGRKLEYVLIIKNSEFYQCVIRTMT
jgi:hypothetical protein